MQRKTKILIIVAHFLLASCAQSKFVLYQEGQVRPLIYNESANKEVVEEFLALFNRIGINLSTTNSPLAENTVGIKLVIDNDVKVFQLIVSGNHLIIKGSSYLNLRKGLRYFFATYTSLNQFTAQKKLLTQAKIILPLDLNYQSNESLTYIEPYFAQNFNQEFRLWNNTNTLESSWALWGHNIGKFIKVLPSMLAVVDGKLNDKQLNFSSAELEKALTDAIRQKLSDDPQVNTFMIMPYDNELVCMCEACLKLGNTNSNASPAVFALIDKLAARFPKALFFSTAYVTTQTPPTQSAKENVGVMISTMAFPKGIVLETSNKAESIATTFKDWRKVTKNIYLWDYAINFDNYFDFFPTVKIAQKNLQYYLDNGVKGIFMHGSDEGSFAAFGDLKAYLYAQLYNQPKTDINSHIQLFLINKYPVIGKELSNYYIKIEDRALQSKKSLDLYGGIQQSANKYIDIVELNEVLAFLLSKKDLIRPQDRSSFDSIVMAFIFQSLELQRTNGLTEKGYGTYINQTLVLSQESKKWLQLLKQYSQTNNIDIYNESKFKLTDYIAAWDTRIFKQPYRNLFYKKSFQVLSKLDEDYTNTSTLNDGAIGFKDYYNNWLINSSSVFELETNTSGLEKASILKVDFLHDERHKIFPPESVTVDIGDRKYQTRVNGVKEEQGERYFVTVELPIEIKSDDTQLKITIKKQSEPRKRLMAFDEIIFR